MMLGLDQTASVYTRNTATGSSGGRFDVLAHGSLACRLVHVGGGESQPERAQLAALRNMLFDPDYDMPEQCQVEVSGIRWRPVAGTFGALRGPSGAVKFRRCDVVRQQ